MYIYIHSVVTPSKCPLLCVVTRSVIIFSGRSLNVDIVCVYVCVFVSVVMVFLAFPAFLVFVNADLGMSLVDGAPLPSSDLIPFSVLFHFFTQGAQKDALILLLPLHQPLFFLYFSVPPNSFHFRFLLCLLSLFLAACGKGC